MEKKIRYKFIKIAMFSLLLVLFVMVAGINIVNYYDTIKEADSTLSILKKNDGKFPVKKHGDPESGIPGSETDSDSRPEPPQGKDPVNSPADRSRAELPFSSRYFYVTFNKDGTISEVDTDSIASISESDARKLAKKVYKSGRKTGTLNDYRYARNTVENKTQYIFLDISTATVTFRKFLMISILMSSSGAFLVFILVFFLSGMVIRPMVESTEKQKRFITDASHEIKTPLAIISANTDVIELENGESEWTVSTKKQIKRLKELTEKMVMLSRLDEMNGNVPLTELNLSDLSDKVTQSYRSRADGEEKTLSEDIDPDIHIKGDKNMLECALSMVLDNAFKYSDDHGSINVSLRKSGKGSKQKVVLTVRNSVDSIIPGRHDRYFERFYRSDSSRNSDTGGSGIGLSVVKACAEACRGKVEAASLTSRDFEIIFSFPGSVQAH